MRKKYRTLTGEIVELDGLTSNEQEFLEQVVQSFENNENYFAVANRIFGEGSPAINGKKWVTKEIAERPIYKVCEDLVDRLGIMQGYLGLDPNTSLEDAGFIE